MSQVNECNNSELECQERERTAIKPPSMYNVILHNDDYTPMDFVVELLNKYFFMTEEQATEVMLKVHHNGKAICGTYTNEVAETKIEQITVYSRENEHPLLCTMEQT